MGWLRFTNESIFYLTQFILVLAITVTLLRIKNKSTPTRLLASLFFGTTVTLLAVFSFFSIYSPWSFKLSILVWFPALIVNTIAIQFAYRFPSEFRLAEAKAALFITVLLTA